MNMTTFPLLYKRTKTGAIQTWQIYAQEDNYFTAEGQLKGVITTSLPTVCKGKNTGKANQTTPEQQAYNEALAKWTKKTEHGYTEDMSQIDTAMKYFEPMLCEPFDKYKDTLDFNKNVYAQPKLDGMRCICNKDGMWSRNGKPVKSAPHIYNSLKHLFDANPELVLDGELYTNKYKNDFNKIMSMVKKQKPTAEELEESEMHVEYWIYDLPSCNEVFSIRNMTLKYLFDNNPTFDSYCVFVQTHLVGSHEELTTLYENWLEVGYEGQIIRKNAKYENKRTKSILKRKEFITDEFEILGFGEGEGDRAGTLGFINCMTKEGKPFRSNIKGSHKYLRELWKNRETLLGKSATIKYFKPTPDGIPRFPFMIELDRESYE